MAGSRQLKIEILGDPKHIAGAFKDVEGAAGKMGTTIGKIGKGAALAIGGIAAAGVGAALLLGPKVLELGGKLEAIGIKSKTVFEDSVGEVQAWADANAHSMGLTANQAVGLAANMGDLLKPMGFTAAQAAEMSTKITDLSGALSAWSGGTKSAAEVSETLSKALLGERDGLKELGISISQAEVDARVAANGQSELTGAALAQAQAIATQQLIMEKSTDAQKAWTDGSMDAMKAQMASTASVAELKEGLVTALYPAVQAILPVLTEMATWLGEHLPTAIAFVRTMIDEHWPAIRDTIVNAVTFIRNWVEEHWAAIHAAITEALDVIKEKTQSVIGWFQDVWAKWGDEIMLVVNTVWPGIQEVIKAVIQTIRAILKTVTDLIQGDWQGAWQGVKDIVAGVWELIKGVVQLAAEALEAILKLAWEGIKDTAKNAWRDFKDWISGIWDDIVDYIGDKIDDLVGLVASIPGRIANAVKGAFNAIGESFRSTINWIIDKWNGLSFSLGGGSYDPLGKYGPTISVPDFTINTPNIGHLHTGGQVGGMTFGGMGDDEVAAILRKGETVLTEGQLQAVTQAPGTTISNVYRIEVIATPGTDRVQLGREIVELIQDFETTSSAQWREAS